MQATYDKLQAEVPKYKMITPSVLSDRLRVCPLNGSCHFLQEHLMSAGNVLMPDLGEKCARV